MSSLVISRRSLAAAASSLAIQQSGQKSILRKQPSGDKQSGSEYEQPGVYSSLGVSMSSLCGGVHAQQSVAHSSLRVGMSSLVCTAVWVWV